MAETVFSKIIRREIPATIVYEDELVIAFRDIAAQAPIHIVIVPKKEIPTINDVEASDAALIGHIVYCAKLVAKQEGIADSGYRLIMNCNEHGGQSVFQLHCHLLGGRSLQWPPG